MHFKKIVGERIYLSPVSEEDVIDYTRWLNDVEVARGMGLHAQVIGTFQQRERMLKDDESRRSFSIILKDGDKLIGNVNLHDLNFAHRKATLGIFIGDEDCRNNGYGAEAIALILDYGFNWLNLHNIMLQVFAPMDSAIACYKKAGFKEFGRRKQSALYDGMWVDDVHMELLSDDYFARQEGRAT